MKVFADAFFYVAFMNRHDEFHERVMQWARGFNGEIVTTQWVLTEVGDAFASSAIRQRVRRVFTELIEDAGTRIIEAAPEHFARGLTLYDERPDKAWSLTDCISFVVMQNEDISEVLTGDHHFAQAGFIPLFASR